MFPYLRSWCCFAVPGSPLRGTSGRGPPTLPGPGPVRIPRFILTVHPERVPPGIAGVPPAAGRRPAGVQAGGTPAIPGKPRQCVKQDDQSPRGPFIHSDKSYFINELSTFSELATVPSIPLRTHSIHYRPADELRRRKETVYATTQRSASSTPCGHAGNIAMAAVTAECTCESPLPATCTGKLRLLSADSVAPADSVRTCRCRCSWRMSSGVYRFSACTQSSSCTI